MFSIGVQVSVIIQTNQSSKILREDSILPSESVLLVCLQCTEAFAVSSQLKEWEGEPTIFPGPHYTGRLTTWAFLQQTIEQYSEICLPSTHLNSIQTKPLTSRVVWYTFVKVVVIIPVRIFS